MKREFSESEVTPFFPGTTFPARVGVYQRHFSFSGSTFYAYWDGTDWHCCAWSPMAARREKTISPQRYLPWRGLRAPANG